MEIINPRDISESKVFGGWKWPHAGSTDDEYVERTQSWGDELCGWVGYGGLGLILLDAVEIDPRDISERKVRKVCLLHH